MSLNADNKKIFLEYVINDANATISNHTNCETKELVNYADFLTDLIESDYITSEFAVEKKDIKRKLSSLSFLLDKHHNYYYDVDFTSSAIYQ